MMIIMLYVPIDIRMSMPRNTVISYWKPEVSVKLVADFASYPYDMGEYFHFFVLFSTLVITTTLFFLFSTSCCDEERTYGEIRKY